MDGERTRIGCMGFRLWTVAYLVLLLAATGATHARAEDDITRVLVEAGKARYGQYCMPCHGAGGAPGDAVHADSKKPVDLRTYVERNGGSFPTAQWLAVFEDVNPGSPHARVWDRIQQGQRVGVSANRAAARAIVGQIARYIASVQNE